MRNLNKLGKLLLLIFTIIFFSNCHNKGNYQEIALLDSYTVYQNGKYNLNIYILDNYDNKKSIEDNIKNQRSIRCLILVIDKQQYDYVEKIKKEISKELVLSNVSIVFDNNSSYLDFPLEQNIIDVDGSILSCDFYMVFDDFQSININKFSNKGINSIKLLE